MKAWTLPEPSVMRYEELPIPVPAPNQVLIHNQAVCFCNGSDPGIYRGDAGYAFPMLFGHEASGIIEQIGSQVSDFQVGDRVGWWCTIGVFAEYVAVNPRDVAMFRLPPNVSVTESPVTELVIASARALMPFSGHAAGRTLTILGLGPSGLVCAQYARVLGFSKVYGLDLYESRRKQALGFGADAVLNPASPEFEQAMSELPGADVALDMMGDDLLPGEPTFNTLLSGMKSGARVVSYGHPDHGRHFRPAAFQGLNLTLTHPENELSVIREKGRAVMESLHMGDIRITPLVTHVLPFEEAGNAFRRMLDSPEQYIKVVFTIP